MGAARASKLLVGVLLLSGPPGFGSQAAEAQESTLPPNSRVLANASDLPERARAQLEITAQVARELSTPQAARAAGYRRLAPASLPDLNPLAGEHWINQRYLRVSALDPAQPAYLMFYSFDSLNSRTLVGLAYGMAQAAGVPPPDGFDGDLDRWHVHLPCLDVPDMATVLAHDEEDCHALGGRPAQAQLSMLHVWLNVPNPEGPFAPDNPALPYVAVGLAPPAAEDLAVPDRAWRIRSLALALGETYGAVPRLGGLINQHPDSAFARRVAPHRRRIRELLPELRGADSTRDVLRYEQLADSAIGEWEIIRQAYLDAASSEALRVLLSRWFESAIDPARHRHGDPRH